MCVCVCACVCVCVCTATPLKALFFVFDRNFLDFFCYTTCSPHQSTFMKVNETRVFKGGECACVKLHVRTREPANVYACSCECANVKLRVRMRETGGTFTAHARARVNE